MTLWTHIQQQWRASKPRDRRALLLAAVVLGVLLLWWLAVAPALRVWRSGDAQRVALDAQYRQMVTLQARARALQALPVVSAADARLALDASLKPLGSSAQVTQQPGRITVTLKGAAAPALAQWLALHQHNPALVLQDVHLKRVDAAHDSWDGSVVLAAPTP